MFTSVSTYRLPYPACCGLADPVAAADVFAQADCVDSLLHYTSEMWDILTDVVLHEWFGIRLPQSKVPWEGPIYLGERCRLLYCLERTSARQLKSDVESRYPSQSRGADAMSIFAGYGLTVPDDMERELDGLDFLARQTNHFRTVNDHLFIAGEEQLGN